MKRSLGVGGVGVLATAAVLDLITPASVGAHNVNLYWGDNEDLLSTSAVNTGDVVGAWQHILCSANEADCSNVDGYFGSVTANGTHAFDTDLMINPADYEVENGTWQSWHYAAFFLASSGSCYSGYTCRYWQGLGGNPQTDFAMSNSSYDWKWKGACNGNDWTSMNHNAITFTPSC